jgi:RHS repeat-associated protein
LDPDTGLNLMGLRWYAAMDSVFAGQDPLGFGGGQTNTEEYCGNSPTNWTDPSGMTKDSAFYHDDDGLEGWRAYQWQRKYGRIAEFNPDGSKNSHFIYAVARLVNPSGGGTVVDKAVSDVVAKYRPPRDLFDDDQINEQFDIAFGQHIIDHEAETARQLRVLHHPFGNLTAAGLDAAVHDWNPPGGGNAQPVVAAVGGAPPGGRGAQPPDNASVAGALALSVGPAFFSADDGAGLGGDTGEPTDPGNQGTITYRGDSRSPSEIFDQGGLQPQGTNMSIENHLYGNEPSGYVGSSYNEAVAVAYAGEGGYAYTIQDPNGIDVNQYWVTKYGEPYYGPYANDAEQLSPHGISWNSISGWQQVGPDDQFSGTFEPNPDFSQ